MWMPPLLLLRPPTRALVAPSCHAFEPGRVCVAPSCPRVEMARLVLSRVLPAPVPARAPPQRTSPLWAQLAPAAPGLIVTGPVRKQAWAVPGGPCVPAPAWSPAQAGPRARSPRPAPAQAHPPQCAQPASAGGHRWVGAVQRGSNHPFNNPGSHRPTPARTHHTHACDQAQWTPPNTHSTD